MEPDYNLEDLIAQLSLRVILFRDAKNPVELPVGIGERELTFLEYLEIVGGESDTSEMGKFFKAISPSTISTNIEKLQRKNYVTRKESPIDRRIKVVSITSKGLEILERVQHERQEKMYKHIAAALEVKEDEIPILSKLILNAIKIFNSVLEFDKYGSKNR